MEGSSVLISGIGNVKFRKEISTKFYEELMILNKGQEKVFDISSDSIVSVFNRIRKKMSFPKQRNIVIQSIRKAVSSNFYKLTKDPFTTMRFANHKNFNTTVRYIQEEGYGAITFTEDIDLDLHKKISHQSLLDALSEMDESFVLLLNNKIKENQNRELRN
ncbi:hypothetical protein JNUCC23_09055 [Peribacillus sp. JNUCC 23]